MSDFVHHDLNTAAGADIHLRNLLAESIEEPWYHSLFRNIKESVASPKLPPLMLTSQPVAVKDIWGLYGRKKESGLMSLTVHACVVMLLFTVLSNPTVQVKVKQAGRRFVPVLAAYLPEKTLQGGGGGGDRSLMQASKGRAPKFVARTFVPPAAVVNNANPKLLIDPNLLGPPDVQTPNNTMAVWGDPLAKLGPPSNGTGSGGGIGSGKNGGIGAGDGPGFGPGRDGGIGEVYIAGGGVSAPALTFQVDPEYSEEARKAKYSGVVVLSIEVDQNGRTRNLRVAKGVGLGLDEKAIEAVKQWRFKPGLKNGKPVIVRAQVEVNFRLL